MKIMNNEAYRKKGQFLFPDGLFHFSMPIDKLPEEVRQKLNHLDYSFEIFSTVKSSNLLDYLKTADDLNWENRKFLGLMSNFNSYFPYIGIFYGRMDERPDFALVFYILFDNNNTAHSLLLNFNQRFDMLATALEDDFAKNFANRLSPNLLQMYRNGKDFLNGNSFSGNAFLITPGISVAICSIGEVERHASMSYWRNLSEAGFNQLVEKFIVSAIETIFTEAPKLETTMFRFVILNPTNTDCFNSLTMKNFIVEPKELNYSDSQKLLQIGYVDRILTYDNSELDPSDIVGVEHIQERIQVYENSYDPRDSQVIAFASYDIGWPDGTNSWMCKIPLSYKKLLEKFDYSELDSKIPNISRAYSNGLIFNFEDGGIVENNQGELIFFYDYIKENKGIENATHLKCSNWLKKTMLELIKFNHYLQIKDSRNKDKSGEKFGDTIKRGIIYQLLGSLMGG